MQSIDKMNYTIALGLCICIVSIRALYFIGRNMGPPNDKNIADRYLRENSAEFDPNAVARLLNLEHLSGRDVLMFMSADCDSVWYLVGENKSVSDEQIIKGYDLMTPAGKSKFRDQWRYWGWTANRMQLAKHVWGVQNE